MPTITVRHAMPRHWRNAQRQKVKTHPLNTTLRSDTIHLRNAKERVTQLLGLRDIDHHAALDTLQSIHKSSTTTERF